MRQPPCGGYRPLQPAFSDSNAAGFTLLSSDCIGQSLERKEQAVKARFITTFFTLTALFAALAPIAEAGRGWP